MTQFFTTLYSKGIIDRIPKDKFPLTHAMCEKNQYEDMKGNNVLIHFQVRYGKLMAVAILHRDGDSIHIYSFEVTADCRLLDYGTAEMNELKREYDSIILNSLNESREFYVKQGFKEVGDVSFVWRKDHEGLCSESI